MSEILPQGLLRLIRHFARAKLAARHAGGAFRLRFLPAGLSGVPWRFPGVSQSRACLGKLGEILSLGRLKIVGNSA